MHLPLEYSSACGYTLNTHKFRILTINYTDWNFRIRIKISWLDFGGQRLVGWFLWPPFPCYNTVSTMFGRRCGMLGIISCSFLSFLSSWYKLILVLSVQRIFFQNWSSFFRCFTLISLPFCCWALPVFELCCEACVFLFIKQSLDCRLCRWYTNLLMSVLYLYCTCIGYSWLLSFTCIDIFGPDVKSSS